MSTLSLENSPEVIALTPRWLVLYKPPGWLTIPGRPTERSASSQGAQPVLSEWVRKEYQQAFVVHRLDRQTSGVILFARNADAHRVANEWFRKHQVKKAYDCLAVGVPKSPLMKIRRSIAEQACTSQVEVKESGLAGFLARVVPVTGRRHQIRIHLSEEGYPLWGDPEYGGPRELQVGGERVEVNRVALHSARLELPTGECFEAPWPEDFKGWVESLRKGGARV